MADETPPAPPPLDKTRLFQPAATQKIPESAAGLAQATQLLHQLATHAVPAADFRDVRTAEFLRAADVIVRPFDFEIVRLIGQGGMGAVFEARDVKLDRPVAIKFILPDKLELFDGMAALLESEARALASINHENAVQIYAIHRHGSNLFIVMEFVKGASLSQFVADHGPLPEPQALRISVQAGRALAALHQQNILHRDIKPENILLSDAGQAKLSDFGLALAQHGRAPSGIASSAAGTPAYMSPEVWEGETPSVRSDIYSLGMTLRFMLTGKRAALGDSLEEIRRTVTHGQLPGLRTERPDVSGETELLVAMALKRSAGQRYQTADAFTAACEKALLRFGVTPEEKPKPPPPRAVLGKGGRALAFALTVFVAGALAGWFANVTVRQGKRLFRMGMQQAGEAVGDLASDVFGDRKKYPLVSAEVAGAAVPRTNVRLIGDVSANRVLDAGRGQFILQDETGGVLVDDPDEKGQINNSLAPGDKVEIVGAVQEWQGLRVVELLDYINRHGRSSAPKALPLALEHVSPHWAGFRVELQDLQWSEQQPNEAGRARVTDGRGHELELRTGADATVLANRPASKFILVGIVLTTAPPGKPAQPADIFVVPLDIRPAPQK